MLFGREFLHSLLLEKLEKLDQKVQRGHLSKVPWVAWSHSLIKRSKVNNRSSVTMRNQCRVPGEGTRVTLSPTHWPLLGWVGSEVSEHRLVQVRPHIHGHSRKLLAKGLLLVRLGAWAGWGQKTSVWVTLLILCLLRGSCLDVLHGKEKTAQRLHPITVPEDHQKCPLPQRTEFALGEGGASQSLGADPRHLQTWKLKSFEHQRTLSRK